MFKIIYTVDMPSCLLLWPLLARLEAKQCKCNPWSQCFATVIAECAVPSIVVWLAHDAGWSLIVVSFSTSYCCIIAIISIHAINCYHIAVNTLLCQLYLATYMPRLSYYNNHCFCMHGWVLFTFVSEKVQRMGFFFCNLSKTSGNFMSSQFWMSWFTMSIHFHDCFVDSFITCYVCLHAFLLQFT